MPTKSPNPATQAAITRLTRLAAALTAQPHEDATAYVAAGPHDKNNWLPEADLVLTVGYNDGYNPDSAAYFAHDPELPAGEWELLGWHNDDAFSGPFSLEPVGGAGTVAALAAGLAESSELPPSIWSECELLAALQRWLKPTGETRKDQITRLLAARAAVSKMG